MSTRPVLKHALHAAQSNHAAKGFDEVAERIFRDDSDSEPFLAVRTVELGSTADEPVRDEPAEEAA